jgi:hypothetical protein
MKFLDRNQGFPQGCPMRGKQAAFLFPLTALALAGCMQTAAPVAAAQPQFIEPLGAALSPRDTVPVGERWF